MMYVHDTGDDMTTTTTTTRNLNRALLRGQRSFDSNRYGVVMVTDHGLGYWILRTETGAHLTTVRPDEDLASVLSDILSR